MVVVASRNLAGLIQLKLNYLFHVTDKLPNKATALHFHIVICIVPKIDFTPYVRFDREQQMCDVVVRDALPSSPFWSLKADRVSISSVMEMSAGTSRDGRSRASQAE